MTSFLENGFRHQRGRFGNPRPVSIAKMKRAGLDPFTTTIKLGRILWSTQTARWRLKLGTRRTAPNAAIVHCLTDTEGGRPGIGCEGKEGVVHPIRADQLLDFRGGDRVVRVRAELHLDRNELLVSRLGDKVDPLVAL